jgi:SAM-dependent methyltransferase
MSKDLEVLAARVNALNKKWPKTVVDKGWLYGVWYCGTGFQKQTYYGQYPLTFVRRIAAMFPTSDYRMLHLCSGSCYIEGATNVDIHKPTPENHVRCDVVADVEDLPFKAGSFDVTLIDPPYSEEDASRYGVKRLIRPKKTVAEVRRVLAPGGWLLWLDEKYPSFRRQEWDLRGLVGIVTGEGRRTRILSMFQVKEDQ